MSKSDSKTYNRPLGAKAYAAIAEVEGVRLTDAGRKRLAKTKHLSQDERRAEVLRAHKTSKPTRKCAISATTVSTIHIVTKAALF